MKRRLRMGMVGGGQGSMMGDVHRLAARMTGCIDLVCGAFSSVRQKAYDTGRELGLPTDRVYGSYRDMLKKEARVPEADRIDFIAIATPNNMHYPISMAALDAGFHILCDRPMTITLDEALNLRRKLQEKGRRYGLTFAHAGYPMLVEARHLVQQGALGEIRKVVVQHPQGWLATRLETAGNPQAGWRTDPRRTGPCGCVADVGAPAMELAQFVTGLALTEVCADAKAFVPGRPLDDDSSVLLRFRNGATGLLWASQVCPGEANGLCLRVYGDRGGLVWRHEQPHLLEVAMLNGPTEVRRAGGAGVSTASRQAQWLPGGMPEGFVEAIANVYRAFAADLMQAEDGPAPDPLPYPSAAEGIRSVSFVDAVARNIRPENSAKWTAVAAAER